MVVIYTQDETYIKNTLEAAKDILFSVYGNKFGQEVLDTLDERKIGSSYRKNGGPLIKIVSKEESEFTRRKEIETGMLKD